MRCRQVALGKTLLEYLRTQLADTRFRDDHDRAPQTLPGRSAYQWSQPSPLSEHIRINDPPCSGGSLIGHSTNLEGSLLPFSPDASLLFGCARRARRAALMIRRCQGIDVDSDWRRVEASSSGAPPRRAQHHDAGACCKHLAFVAESPRTRRRAGGVAHACPAPGRPAARLATRRACSVVGRALRWRPASDVATMLFLAGGRIGRRGEEGARWEDPWIHAFGPGGATP